MAEEQEDVRVYIRHVRQAGLCSRGLRAWGVANNKDLTKFLQEGILASEIEHIDAFSKRIVAVAREEARSNK